MSPSHARRAHAVGGAALALALLYAVLAAAGPERFIAYPGRALPDVLVLAGALACLARGALRRPERAAWLPLGLALGAWAGGDLAYSLLSRGGAEPPLPSAADALWLLFYPAAAVGLLALARRRIGRLPASLGLDGLIAGLTVAAVGITFAGPPILASAEGDALLLATILAYPIGDVALLALATGVAAAARWRPGTTWLLAAAALAGCAVADGWFAYAAATQPVVEGTPLDGLFPLAAVVVAAAAWRPTEVARRPPTTTGWPTLVLPALLSAIALAVLAGDRYHPVPTAAWILTAVALGCAILRGGLTFAENQRVSAARGRDALTDALTGLGNRRRLVEDLEAVLATPPGGACGALVLLDLDGFKAYNDAFGHPAGDELLRTLGRRLETAIGPAERAYRLGGDEFCVLSDRTGAQAVEAVAEAARRALTHEEDTVRVGCSGGAIRLPDEAATVASALRLADERLYHRKAGRLRSAAGEQARDTLLRALAERENELGTHMSNVTALALRVAGRLGVPAADRETIAAAAQLHDVGKLAFPDRILRKPGPLDELEWVFVRQHTLVGERIIAAAPALEPVARLVRASHERWDGAGYPDGLRAEEIPIGARIVAVCDAYDAMTSHRPYERAQAPEAALHELERCAGTQFDPGVVDALRIELVGGDREADRPQGPAASPTSSPSPRMRGQ